MKLFLAGVCVLIALCACGDGNSTPVPPDLNSASDADADAASGTASDQASDSPEDGSFTGDPSTPPDSSLISRVDTSATTNAVSSGINPTTTPISTRFHCYKDEQTGTDQPDFLLVVDGDTFTLSGAENASGTIRLASDERTQTFITSEGDEMSVDIEFDEFGQELNFGSVTCYQEGAAHEAALHQWMLNTPDAGVFSCPTTDSSSDVSVEIIDESRYRAAGKTGNYEFASSVTDDSSDVYFVTGPLQGAEATYRKDPKGNTETLYFEESSSQVFFTGQASYSSSLAAQCSRQGESEPFKLYGQATAPKAATPERPLSGLYFVDRSELTGDSRSDAAEYVDFRADGYLRFGLPLPGGTNCTLTQPNGLPLCWQYQFDGRTLSIMFPWKQTVSMSARVTGDGSLQSLDGDPVERMAPVEAASILGSWESQDVDSGGIANCLVGSCSSSITDRSFQFRADGQYLFTIGNESNSSFDTGVMTSLANGNSSDQNTGTYRIVGYSIELTTTGGATGIFPVHLTQSDTLAIGETQYRRP